MLAKEGAKVVATDVNIELLEKLKVEAADKNLAIEIHKLDVTKKEEIQNVVDKFEQVDVLFNCAG